MATHMAQAVRTVLHQFLSQNRDNLIDRCSAKVARRATTGKSIVNSDSAYGIPLFLDQLIETLRLEQSADPAQSYKISAQSGGIPMQSEMGIGAKQRGYELLRQGFSVDQVVHDYGDLCQSITDMAFENSINIHVDEFRTLNRCLDNAIADSVMEFTYQNTLAINEQLGSLAHEIRNRVSTAILAVEVLKTGKVGADGSIGKLIDRSLRAICVLIDSTVTDVRINVGIPTEHSLVSLAKLIEEIRVGAVLEAEVRKSKLRVSAVEPTLAVDVNSELLSAAVGNLLQNAFKFTCPGADVSLHAYAVGDRIRIDVEDGCGGLPSDFSIATPFYQGNPNKFGLGLGLSICRRNVEADKGVLTVRDVPGKGCVFTIDLPRFSVSGIPAMAGDR